MNKKDLSNESCMPNGMPKRYSVYISTKLLSLWDISASLVSTKQYRIYYNFEMKNKSF